MACTRYSYMQAPEYAPKSDLNNRKRSPVPPSDTPNKRRKTEAAFLAEPLSGCMLKSLMDGAEAAQKAREVIKSLERTVSEQRSGLEKQALEIRELKAEKQKQSDTISEQRSDLEKQASRIRELEAENQKQSDSISERTTERKRHQEKANGLQNRVRDLKKDARSRRKQYHRQVPTVYRQAKRENAHRRTGMLRKGSQLNTLRRKYQQLKAETVRGQAKDAGSGRVPEMEADDTSYALQASPKGAKELSAENEKLNDRVKEVCRERDAEIALRDARIQELEDYVTQCDAQLDADTQSDCADEETSSEDMEMEQAEEYSASVGESIAQQYRQRRAHCEDDDLSGVADEDTEMSQSDQADKYLSPVSISSGNRDESNPSALSPPSTPTTSYREIPQQQGSDRVPMTFSEAAASRNSEQEYAIAQKMIKLGDTDGIASMKGRILWAKEGGGMLYLSAHQKTKDIISVQLGPSAEIAVPGNPYLPFEEADISNENYLDNPQLREPPSGDLDYGNFILQCALAHIPEIHWRAAHFVFKDDKAAFEKFKEKFNRVRGSGRDLPQENDDDDKGKETCSRVVGKLMNLPQFQKACIAWSKDEHQSEGTWCWPPKFSNPEIMDETALNPGGIQAKGDSVAELSDLMSNCNCSS